MYRIKGQFPLMVLCSLFAAALAAGEQVSKSDTTIDTLRKGGCYIVMRHASAPRDPPAPGAEASGNTARERQLDAPGKASARAMGEALRRLEIPIGGVLSSPTWRARETAQEARLPQPTLVPQLGDGGQSMSAASAGQTDWLRELASREARGGNVIVITHFPNLRAAFPEYAADLADGEALILRPDPAGKISLLRRVRIEEWPEFKVE
jgi:phosphohistidine phosphatase SixA